MNLYLFKAHPDAEENAAAQGLYYLSYTMMNTALVAAETPEKAREILCKDRDTQREEVYKHADVLECVQIGISVDPFNIEQIIHTAWGTG